MIHDEALPVDILPQRPEPLLWPDAIFNGHDLVTSNSIRVNTGVFSNLCIGLEKPRNSS